jgi:hypothetical protein
MPGDTLFVSGAEQLDDRELVSGGLPLGVRQQQPDPVIATRLTGGGNPPEAIHLQMGVHGQARVGADQQVLAARERFGHRLPGQAGGGESWHTEVAAGQRPSGQRIVESAGGVPNNVTFGHLPSLPRPRRQAMIMGTWDRIELVCC